MNIQVLSLIKQRYCEDNAISDPESIAMSFCQAEKGTGNPIMFVLRDGKSSTYVHQRIDLAGLSAHRALDIPAAFRNVKQADLSKVFIADWVYQFTGHRILVEDIQTMALEKKAIQVIISPDSMRFKNSFQLIRL